MQGNHKLEWNRKQIAKCWQVIWTGIKAPPMNTEITGAPRPWQKVISWTFIGLALFQIIDPLNVLRHARNKANSCLMVMADWTLSKLSIISYGLNPCIKFWMISSPLETKKRSRGKSSAHWRLWLPLLKLVWSGSCQNGDWWTSQTIQTACTFQELLLRRIQHGLYWVSSQVPP